MHGGEVIRIDALWLATQPIDMRAGADALLARVVHVFGSAQAHHGYLFANARASRIKLLVHDGFGVWCAARRLNVGRFARRIRLACDQPGPYSGTVCCNQARTAASSAWAALPNAIKLVSTLPCPPSS